MNAKTVEEIVPVLRGFREGRDRIEGYRPLSVDVIRQLTEGRPVPERRIREFAAHRGLPASTVDALIHGAEWSEAGLVGVTGLTLNETRHRLEVDDQTLWTWCAWDSLFLVPIIGRRATLTSTSPATNIDIRISIASDGVTAAEPETTVLSVVVPRADAVVSTAAEVQATFCHFVHFFEDRAAAEAWVPAERDPAVLEPGEGFRLGQLVYGDLAAAPAAEVSR